jgi:hypothetical protein
MSCLVHSQCTRKFKTISSLSRYIMPQHTLNRFRISFLCSWFTFSVVKILFNLHISFSPLPSYSTQLYNDQDFDPCDIIFFTQTKTANNCEVRQIFHGRSCIHVCIIFTSWCTDTSSMDIIHKLLSFNLLCSLLNGSIIIWNLKNLFCSILTRPYALHCSIEKRKNV